MTWISAVTCWRARAACRSAWRAKVASQVARLVQAVDDHLRHAVKRFYVELEQVLQPIEAFSEAQKKTMEPSLVAVRDLETKLARCAAELGGAA